MVSSLEQLVSLFAACAAVFVCASIVGLSVMFVFGGEMGTNGYRLGVRDVDLRIG